MSIKKQYRPIAEELTVALEQLVVRFPLHGYAETAKTCKCLQFEDNRDCRHLMAVRALKRAKKAGLV